MKNTLKRAEQNPSIIFLTLAILIGGYIRLSGVLKSDFPLNDGGLFYTMTQDLIANGFRIPEFTTYNHLNIPFAYPPLGFYLAGFLNQFLGWDLLDIFRILPAVFTVGTIPAFYLLARKLIIDDFQVGLAVLIFALLPTSFDWVIMGGGITRAPGFLFSILSLFYVIRLFTQRKRKHVFLSSIFASLTILTHPETALHTLASVLILFIFFGKSKSGIIKPALVATLTIFLTSPWWITVLMKHGFKPFLAAGAVGFSGWEWIIKLINFDFSSEYYVQSISVLGLIGLFILLGQKNYLLPVLFTFVFFSAPRSATRSLSPILALLASYALIFIQIILNHNKYKDNEENGLIYPRNKSSMVFLCVLIVQWIISSLTTVNTIQTSKSISLQDKIAFDWVKENTAVDSRFLILTGQNPLLDPVSEWFPALTERESIATLYGYEWIKGVNFKVKRNEFHEVQNCLDRGIACMDEWNKQNNSQHDYLLISKISSGIKGKFVYQNSIIELVILKNPDQKLVFENDRVSILRISSKK